MCPKGKQSVQFLNLSPCSEMCINGVVLLDVMSGCKLLDVEVFGVFAQRGGRAYQVQSGLALAQAKSPTTCTITIASLSRYFKVLTSQQTQGQSKSTTNLNTANSL